MKSIPERITLAGVGVPIVLTALLFLAYGYSFSLFHTLAELFSVFIALVAAVVAWTTRSFSRNSLVTYVGSGYFCIGILDLIHALGARGVEMLPLAGQYPEVKVWLAARWLESILLVTAPLFSEKHVNAARVLWLFGAPSLLMLFAVQLDLFPQVFVEGQGLTPFKIGGEYVVVSLLVLALFHWHKQNRTLEPFFVGRFTLAIIFTIFAELSLTLYVSLDSPAVFIGHILKLFSFWLVYHAIVRTSLQEPLRLFSCRASIYDAIPDPVVVVTRHGRISHGNAAARAYAFSNAAELVGGCCHTLFHLGPREECPVCLLIERGEPRCGVELHDEQTRRRLEVTLARVEDVLPLPGMLHSLRDTSEARAVQETLERGEARLNEAQRVAQLGSWDWDVRQDEMHWSNQLYYLLDLPADRGSPTISSFVDCFHPDDRPRLEQCLRVAREDGSPFAFEARAVLSDGAERDVHGEGTVDRDESGGILRLVGTVQDITERKRVEKAVRESENKYRALMEHVNIAILVAVEDGQIVEANEWAERLFGFGRAELKSLHIHDLIPEEDMEVLHAALRDMQEKGASLYEHGIICRDGSVRHAEVAGARVDIGDERLFIGLFRDISDRRDAEQALRASEQRYRTLVESLPQAVFLKDTNSVVLSCNSNYARWLDRAPEQVIGHSAEDFHPAHLAAKYEQDDRRIMASGVTESIEELAVRKDGEYLVNTVKAPVRDAEGKVVGLIGIFWDITEQKKAENLLRESEARFAEAEQIGGMGSWEWYVNTDMLYWSCGLYQITGDDPEVYSPTFADAVARVPPDARASFDADIQQLLQGGVQHRYDHPFLAADGSLRFLHVRARPVRDASGKVLRVVGSVLDITDRKRNEDELQSYREDLELRVAERTTKLQAAIRELESFSYSVSHDLHAPLRAINGFSHLLAEDFRGSLDREAGDYLDKIIQASSRMGQLIDGLLMLAKVVRKEPELLLLDMGDLAREVARELRAGEPGRNVRFVIPDGVQVLADQALLRLLLQNLLGNAWKFTRREENPVIELGRVDRHGQEVFFVRDNGIGIDAQFSGQLFRPFHRLHTEEEYEGTGIGLATVLRITQHHGGSIWLEGELGKGTLVQFTLSGLTEPL